MPEPARSARLFAGRAARPSYLTNAGRRRLMNDSSMNDSSMNDSSLKEVVETIARALVDNPDDVAVTEVDGEAAIVLELRVAPQDLGKVIGKQGRTARAMRT